jgi:coenzyme F420-reducing hydrogenase alpha subunit
MHYGQILQSHALHFFHLSSPDLLFGFDSDVAKRNIVGVAAAHPDIAKRACCCASSARKSSASPPASACMAPARSPAA